MKIENDTTVKDFCDEKHTVSARVNQFIYKIYQEKEIPISLVIENSLTYFLTLDDNEKIKFLSNTMPDVTLMKNIKAPSTSWKEMITGYTSKLGISKTVSAALITGTAIGAIALIGGLLSNLGDEILKTKKDQNK